LIAHSGEQVFSDHSGPGARQPENQLVKERVAPADDAVGEHRRQQALQRVGEAVFGRSRDDIGRRALQHGDLPGIAGQRRHQGHRRGAAADDDNALAAVVEVGWPVLRMHDAAGKAFAAGEFGREPRRVVVIARAHVEKIAAQPQILSVVLHRHQPARGA
jgi:hypothetical protein